MSPTADAEGFDAQVASVAALGDRVRRALYRYVVAQPEAVSRDQAAAGTGVAHHVAKRPHRGRAWRCPPVTRHRRSGGLPERRSNEGLCSTV